MSNSNQNLEEKIQQKKKTFYSTKEFIQNICGRELLLSCTIFEKISKVTVDGRRQSKSSKRQIDKVLESGAQEFKDLSFSPEDQSLNPIAQKNSKLVKFIFWYRIKNFFKEKYSLYKEIKMSTQVAYNPAYSYIIDAMNVLSTQPGLVLRLFEKKKVNSQGIYSVWLNINGIWKNFIIDDYLPVFGDVNKRTQFFFSTPNPEQCEIWYCLLEKALAKAYGGYHCLANGTENYAMRDFTGAPYKISEIGTIPQGKILTEEDIERIDDVWNKIRGSLRKGDVMSAMPRGMSQMELQRSSFIGGSNLASNSRYLLGEGIYCNHSYAIVTLDEVVGSDGNQYKLVKLRNPWINEVWTGKWSHDCPLWTPQAQRKLKYSPKKVKKLNQFWMDFREFFSYFTTLSIYKARPGFTYNSIEVGFLKNKRYLRSIVRLSIYSKGRYTFSVNQQSKMNPHQVRKNFNPIKMSVGMISDTGFKLFIHTSSNNLRNTYLRKHFTKGEYYILIEQFCDPISFNSMNSAQNLVVSAYGPQTCGLKLVNDAKKAELMYDYIYYYGWKGYSYLKNGNKLYEFKVNFFDGSNDKIPLFLLKIQDSVIYAFKNENPFGIEINVNIEPIFNKEILGPEGIVSYKQKFILEPGSTDVFILREKQILDSFNPKEKVKEVKLKFLTFSAKKFDGQKSVQKTFERAVKSLLKQRSEEVKCEIEGTNYEKKWGIFNTSGQEILFHQKSSNNLDLSPTSVVIQSKTHEIHETEESKILSAQEVTASESESDDETEESEKKSKKGLRVSYYDVVYKEEIERGEMDKENLQHVRAKSVGGEVKRTKSILKNKNKNQEKEKRNVENIEKIAKEIGPIDDEKLTKLISLQKEEVLRLPNEELKMILKYFGIHAFVSIYQADQKFIDDISEKLSKDNTCKNDSPVKEDETKKKIEIKEEFDEAKKKKEEEERKRFKEKIEKEKKENEKRERKMREDMLIEEERKKAEEEARLEKLRKEKRRKKKKKTTFKERSRSKHRRGTSGSNYHSNFNKNHRKKTPKKIKSQSQNKLIENSLKNFTPRQEKHLNRTGKDQEKKQKVQDNRLGSATKKKKEQKIKKPKRKPTKKPERAMSKKSRNSSKGNVSHRKKRLLRNFTSSSPKMNKKRNGKKESSETLEQLRKRIKSIKNLNKPNYQKSSYRKFASPSGRRKKFNQAEPRKFNKKSDRRSFVSSGKADRKNFKKKQKIQKVSHRKKSSISYKSKDVHSPRLLTRNLSRSKSRKSVRSGKSRSRSRSKKRTSQGPINIYSKIAQKMNRPEKKKSMSRKRKKGRRTKSKTYSKMSKPRTSKGELTKNISMQDSLTSQDLSQLANQMHTYSTKSQQDEVLKGSYFQKNFDPNSITATINQLNEEILNSNPNSTSFTPTNTNNTQIVYRTLDSEMKVPQKPPKFETPVQKHPGISSIANSSRNISEQLRESYYSVSNMRNSNFINSTHQNEPYHTKKYHNHSHHTAGVRTPQTYHMNHIPATDNKTKAQLPQENPNLENLFAKKPGAFFNTQVLRGSRSYFKKKSGQQVAEFAGNQFQRSNLRSSGYKKPATSQGTLRQSNYISDRNIINELPSNIKSKSGSLSHSNLPQPGNQPNVAVVGSGNVNQEGFLQSTLAHKGRSYKVPREGGPGVVGFGLSAALNQTGSHRR